MRYRPYQKPCPQASAPSLAQIHPEVCEHLHPDLMGPQTYAYHNQIHPNGSGSASLSGMPPQASTPVYPDLVHPKFHERSLVPTGWNVEDSQTSRSDFEELPTDVVPLPPPPPAQAAVVDVPSCSVLPMTPRMFDCHITVVVYCSKKNKQKQDVWKSIRTPKDCWITFDCRSIDYESFHQLVADECSKTYTKMPKLAEFAAWIQAITVFSVKNGGIVAKMSNPGDKIVQAANEDLLSETVRRSEAREATLAAQLQGSSSGLAPLGLMGADDSDGDSCDEEFQARAIIKEDIFNRYKRNTSVDAVHPIYPDPTDFNRYIILTPGNVALWAKAIHQKHPGVSVVSPPTTLKFYNCKTKKSAPLGGSPSVPAPQINTSEIVATVIAAYQATMASQGTTGTTRGPSPPSDVADPPAAENPGVLADYLRFAGVTNTEETLRILERKDIDSYKMFANGYMPEADLKDLGLTKGTLAKLRNNVRQHQRSLVRETE
ncbi:hypothetical protein PtA15_9A346 [Puccinia triticina]|uniref:SAM domain-containing protein n=1 Tax=Puccinia triticina TaxID=208348 RepID=A0ABY7CSL6_9BASI|nr:uncharacterized protein PtA15_9A346 [Puccinia triticina]WAQ88219.1 hypothetical protein PtA15_9A346 [Puccinia triticina]